MNKIICKKLRIEKRTYGLKFFNIYFDKNELKEFIRAGKIALGLIALFLITLCFLPEKQNDIPTSDESYLAFLSSFLIIPISYLILNKPEFIGTIIKFILLIIIIGLDIYFYSFGFTEISKDAKLAIITTLNMLIFLPFVFGNK